MAAKTARAWTGPGPVRWGLRAYAPVVALSILLMTIAVPWLVQNRVAEEYQSQALVVAQRVSMPLAALPRYGEAVFNNGGVEQRVGARFGRSNLVPDDVSVVTAQDSVVLTVVARDTDPGVAASMANVAAEAFLEELNRPGPELAFFVVQRRAQPSEEPEGLALGLPVQLVMGGMAGATLGLGLIALLLALRKPLVDLDDIEHHVAAPVLGVLRLPTRGVPDPFGVPGLAPVARTLLRMSPAELVVVSARDRRAQRSAVARLLASALDRWRPTTLQAQGLDGAVWTPSAEDDIGHVPSLLVVTDVARPLDLSPGAVDADTVLVLREGTPERRLWEVLADHADARFLGVVVVRPRAAWTRWFDRDPVGHHVRRTDGPADDHLASSQQAPAPQSRRRAKAAVGARTSREGAAGPAGAARHSAAGTPAPPIALPSLPVTPAPAAAGAGVAGQGHRTDGRHSAPGPVAAGPLDAATPDSSGSVDMGAASGATGSGAPAGSPPSGPQPEPSASTPGPAQPDRPAGDDREALTPVLESRPGAVPGSRSPSNSTGWPDLR